MADSSNNHNNEDIQADPKLPSKSSGIVIPVAIVLIGALIIFGISKMISSDRNHRDLVREMHSKTFGNRWIAAFELSKYISSERIPKDEIPWLIKNLDELYDNAKDIRTKNFIVTALGALHSPLILPTLYKALNHENSETRFYAVVALGKLPIGGDYKWRDLIFLLKDKDDGIKQATILTFATHRVALAEKLIENLLVGNSISIRYAAATGLIYFKNKKCIPTLKEILFLKSSSQTGGKFGDKKIHNLKMNVLNAIGKMEWPVLNVTLDLVAQRDKDLKVVTKTRELLNQLKN